MKRAHGLGNRFWRVFWRAVAMTYLHRHPDRSPSQACPLDFWICVVTYKSNLFSSCYHTLLRRRRSPISNFSIVRFICDRIAIRYGLYVPYCVVSSAVTASKWDFPRVFATFKKEKKVREKKNKFFLSTHCFIDFFDQKMKRGGVAAGWLYNRRNYIERVFSDYKHEQPYRRRNYIERC